MLRNFKILIEYDGKAYHGWQRQKNEATIQGEIEWAIEKMIGQKVPLIGSGRTDAGVHALNQVANFKCDTHLTPGVFQKGLTAILPADIVIKSCEEVPEGFHARFDVKSKTYLYRILNHKRPSAIGRHYAWHIPFRLDVELMACALEYFVGTHDFKAFEGAGSPRQHTVRTVKKAALIPRKNKILHIEIKANGFLRHMVRNIVGALVAVGSGRLTPEQLNTVFLSRDRRLAPPTAPPQGLFLGQVSY
jgi:tRNA pseudouridine38-40 synthase